MLFIPSLPLAYKNTTINDYLHGDKDFSWLYPNARLWVEGEECPVRDCRVSAVPFNRLWPGYQRDRSQSEAAGYSVFCADGPVTLRVQSEEVISSAVVRPLSKGVTVKRLGEREVEFTLQVHGGYVLELNGQHHPLHLFFDPVKPLPTEEGATRYFGPGVHFAGIIEVKDHDRICIHPEALVFGSLYSQGAKDVRIYGGGVLDGGTENRLFEHCYEPFTKGTLRLYNCSDVVIEDIILKDSATWVLSLFDCQRVQITNVKAVGHWRYNTDGIDVVNSSDVTVRHCFLHVFDDAVTLKGIYDCQRPLENVTVEDCVLWCSWGRTLEVGVETDVPRMKNIRFTRCDCIRNAHVALDIRSGHGADVEDVVFEDVSVEFQKDFLAPLYQHGDDAVYDPARSKYPVPSLLQVDNKIRYGSRKEGSIRKVKVKNLSVFLEEGCAKPQVLLENCNAQADFEAVEIDGLFVNGEKQKDFSAFDARFLGGASAVWKE